MVSLQQHSNAMQVDEIDPGPPMSLVHEFVHAPGPPGPRTAGLNTATKALSTTTPAEQELEGSDISDLEPADIGWEGGIGRGTNRSHKGTKKEVEGGITSERPEYSCPFALGSPGAHQLEEPLGASGHLRTYLSGSSVKYVRGSSAGPYASGRFSDESVIRDQARGQASPDMRPRLAHHGMVTGALGSATSARRGQHVLPRISSPVELLRTSYDTVVIGSGYRGDVASACTLRAGEDMCVPTGGQSLRGYDNVNKTVTSGEACIDAAERSFDVKWKAAMKLSHPPGKSSAGAADVSMREALMWMIEYNLVSLPVA
ncbi:hypothetical protein KVR01_009300 [Diaporthe batatas]|uniref:uncharacterized protein n=1 Tax=Diaporthe batatas TaxID=748121 RepID=UPI001D05BD16|nr:uncharacterized protein KVR01_009300 [Diaporthe batatas]KAG8161036.1 hypothetical protein KVR01_009300 [Diaporthe batatas]